MGKANRLVHQRTSGLTGLTRLKQLTMSDYWMQAANIVDITSLKPRNQVMEIEY